MREVTWATAALLGLAVALALAVLPPVWPALSISAGGAVVAGALLRRGRGRRRYALAGTAYCLGLAAAYSLPVALADGYAGSPRVALASLGAVSAILLVAWIVLVRSVERTYRVLVDGGGVRGRLAQARTAAKLLGLLRTVVGLFGRLARAGVLAAVVLAVVLVAGLVAFALDGLGVQVLVPWPVAGEVDAVLLTVVAAVLAGFYALGGAETTWIATQEAVEDGRWVATRVGRLREDRAESEVEE